MDDRYILEITKQGEQGEDAVKIRLHISEDKIRRVIAAASDLSVPRVVKAKAAKAGK